MQKFNTDLLESNIHFFCFTDGCCEQKVDFKDVTRMIKEVKKKLGDQEHPIPVGAHDMKVHAQVYGLADKYFVKGLKENVSGKFDGCVWNMFAGDEFFEAVEVVFTTTPETDKGLRDMVIQRIHKEKSRFRFKMDFNVGLKKALKEIPDLAYCLLEYEVQVREDKRLAKRARRKELLEKERQEQ